MARSNSFSRNCIILKKIQVLRENTSKQIQHEELGHLFSYYSFDFQKQTKNKTQCLRWLKLLTGSQRSSASTELKDRAEFMFLNAGSYFGSRIDAFCHNSTLRFPTTPQFLKLPSFTPTCSQKPFTGEGKKREEGGRHGGSRCLNTAHLCCHILVILIHEGRGSFGAQIVLLILGYY